MSPIHTPLFQTTFDQLPEARILLSTDLTIVAINKACEAAYRGGETLIGRNFLDVFHDVLERGGNLSKLKSALTEGATARQSIVLALFSFETGQTKELEHLQQLDIFPIPDAHGETEFLMCILDYVPYPTPKEELKVGDEKTAESIEFYRDEVISLRQQIVQLNEKLVLSEQRFGNMVMESPVAMMVLQGDSLVIDVINSAMLEIINKDRSVTGKPLFDVMPEIKGQTATDLFHTVLQTGEPKFGYEIPVLLRRNGSLETGYFNFAYTPFTRDGRITGLIDVAVDVTHHVNARLELEKTIAEKTVLEETLRANEARLKGILETMAEGVGIVDSKGQLVYANPMAQGILGLEEREITERTYYDTRWQNLRIDGTPLPSDEHPMAIMMRTALPLYDQEIAVQPPDKEKFYISINAAPILDEQGNVTGGIGTFMNVTKRRKLIMEKDDFISVASHELKTPVTSLKASVQLLERLGTGASPEMQSKLLAQVNKSVGRLSDLIKDLLNSDRINQGQLLLHKTNFNIAQVINNCYQHIRSAGKHKIILQGDLDATIYGDEHQINQVIVNFVNNAIKYAPHSLEILIHVAALEGSTKVSVTDKGPGIDPGKKPHLFDRYYRADYSGSQFSGLGLGLYISAEIIKKHGGEIGADSIPGQGSTFWFTVPNSG